MATKAKTAKRKCPFEDYYKPTNGGVVTQEKDVDGVAAKSGTRHYQQTSFRGNKPQKWEQHAEAAMGYYFHIAGPKYCYVSEYQGATVIHVRVYDENKKTGRLIPTKTGCCLRAEEWAVLRDIGQDVLEQLDGLENAEAVLRRPLGPISNWYIMCGTDLHGQGAISIRLLMPTRNQKSNEMCSTTKGLTFNSDEWQAFVSMFTEIGEAVSNIEESFTN